MRVADPTLNITTLPAPPRPAATSLHRSPFPLRRDGHAPEPQLLLHGVLQSQRPPPQPVAVRPCSPRCARRIAACTGSTSSLPRDYARKTAVESNHSIRNHGLTAQLRSGSGTVECLSH